MRLFVTSAAIALLFAGPVLAQQNAGTAPDSAGANSASNSNAQQSTNLINGGSSANNGGVKVGDTTSSSQSGAQSGSVSGSFSQGGDGGHSTAASNATGGNATNGPVSASATASPTASNAGNAQNITFNSPAVPTKTTTRVESLPTVYAPALSTTLTETCMGSTSGGVSVMGFGGTLGTTWNDSQCVRRLNAREMAQTLGDRAAARALMCQDKDVAAAYLAVGQDCRQKYEIPIPVAQAAPISPVVINVPAPAASPPAIIQMAPVPNPQIIYRDRPARKAKPHNVPACKIDPHYSCPK